MAFTDEHYAVTIATLAAVEAGGNYGVITAPDTLSLGIGQWTQGRAYALLKRFPSGTDFGSTVNGWLNQGADSWTIGARKYQYLNGNDRAKLSGALASSTGHQIQDSQMYMDIHDSYLPRCKELGLDPEAHPDAAILLMVVMHRWGNYGRILPRIVASASPSFTVSSMEAAIRYSGEYSMVPNRYKVAFPMVEHHVTNGVKVNGKTINGGTADASATPGDNGHNGNGDDEDAKDDKASTVKNVRYNGDGTLAVTLGDGTKATVYPTSVGYWTGSPDSQVKAKGKTPQVDSSTHEDAGSGASSAGGAPGSKDERIAKMIAEAKADYHRFTYHQWYQPRLHPDKTGVTDCSGFCWYLFNKYLGVDINPGGTGAIINSPVGKVIASGSGTFNAHSKIQPGDIIVCRWFSGGGHVELCIGNGLSIGARGPDGHPEPGGPASVNMFAGCTWKLKRYV